MISTISMPNSITTISDYAFASCKNLKEVVDLLNNKIKIEPFVSDVSNIKVSHISQLVFSDVRGQERVKRALEIVAAGAHNCILIGSPRFWKNYVISKAYNNIV